MLPDGQQWMLPRSDASRNRTSLSWQAWMLLEAHASRKRADGMLLERAHALVRRCVVAAAFLPLQQANSGLRPTKGRSDRAGQHD